MTLYTIKWTETSTHEVDIDAPTVGDALEEFWHAWTDSAAETVVTSTGPQNVETTSYTAYALRSRRSQPKEKT